MTSLNMKEAIARKIIIPSYQSKNQNSESGKDQYSWIKTMDQPKDECSFPWRIAHIIKYATMDSLEWLHITLTLFKVHENDRTVPMT